MPSSPRRLARLAAVLLPALALLAAVSPAAAADPDPARALEAIDARVRASMAEHGTPGTVRFEEIVDGRALQAVWSGHTSSGSRSECPLPLRATLRRVPEAP